MSKSIMVASTASSVGLGVLQRVAPTASGDWRCEFLAGISGQVQETPQVDRQPVPSGQPVCRRRQALRLASLGRWPRVRRTAFSRRFLGPKVNGRCDIRAKALNCARSR